MLIQRHSSLRGRRKSLFEAGFLQIAHTRRVKTLLTKAISGDHRNCPFHPTTPNNLARFAVRPRVASRCSSCTSSPGRCAAFSASTPLAKLLTATMPPLLLARLLYLGSGFGFGLLLILRRIRERRDAHAVTRLHITRIEMPWLLGAIVADGTLGPALFMLGLD